MTPRKSFQIQKFCAVSKQSEEPQSLQIWIPRTSVTDFDILQTRIMFLEIHINSNESFSTSSEKANERRQWQNWPIPSDEIGNTSFLLLLFLRSTLSIDAIFLPKSFIVWTTSKLFGGGCNTNEAGNKYSQRTLILFSWDNNTCSHH